MKSHCIGKLAQYLRGGVSIYIFTTIFLSASPVLAANIEYNGIGADLRPAPDAAGTGNSFFPYANNDPTQPIASGNTITIDFVTGSGNTNPNRAFGGVSKTESTNNNTVYMKNGTVDQRIYGGYATTAGYGASDNRVFMSGGTVTNDVYGTYTADGDSTNNLVEISGGTVGGWVAGGIANLSGISSGNRVILTSTAGTIGGDITGGQSQNGTAADNTVEMHGGVVNLNIFGGRSTNSDSTNNRVLMSGGTVKAGVHGGYSDGSNVKVTGNQVTLSGGAIVEGRVHGGYDASIAGGGQVSSNYVYITDTSSAKQVIGGMSIGQAVNPGTTTDNHVIISGGNIGSAGLIGTLANVSVVGGVENSGKADGNSVSILGGVFAGDIYGGVVGSGGANRTANNNIVSISGTPELENSGLYGGVIHAGPGNSFNGNTLNINGFRGAVKSTSNFENYNFLLPASVANGGTILTITGGTPTDLANTNVAITSIEGGAALTPGNAITLINSTQNTPSSMSATNVQQGFSLLYDFDLSAAGNVLTATVRNMKNNPQSNAFPESWLAGLAFATQGADLIEGQGVFLARRAAVETRSGPAVFAAFSGSYLRYNTGSHIDVDGFSMLTGLAWNGCSTPGYLTFGTFFETGWGNYDSFNDFAGFASVHGDGNTKYYGGGILGRLDLPSGFYAEASARAGRVDTDFNSNDLRDPLGRTAWYDGGSAYYGAHAGLGFIWKPTQKLDINLFTKYLWTHQNSDDANIYGDPIHFSAADSQRWRTGARLSYSATPCISPYVGAAFEYEFDGKARATAYGMKIDAPSLKGGTGVGELGVTFKEAVDRGFFADLGVQGYVGKREGVTGRLQVGWKF